MHLFFLTRAIKRNVDELVKWLETRAMRLPIYDDKGNLLRYEVFQANLQPIQLWSYVFPEFEKDVVLNSICTHPTDPLTQSERWANTPKMKSMVWGLRKALGAEKIPEFKRDKKLHLPMELMQDFSIIPIGIKEDNLNYKDPNGTIHEAI